MWSLTIFNGFAALGLILGGIFFRYRTPRFRSRLGLHGGVAGKNEDVWNEAHRYAAGPMIVAGACLLLVAALPLLTRGAPAGAPSGMAIGGAGLMVSALTRNHIRRHFDEDGRRR